MDGIPGGTLLIVASQYYYPADVSGLALSVVGVRIPSTCLLLEQLVGGAKQKSDRPLCRQVSITCKFDDDLIATLVEICISISTAEVHLGYGCNTKVYPINCDRYYFGFRA